MQQISSEQKEMLRLQLERVHKTVALKEKQILFKRERARLLRLDLIEEGGLEPSEVNNPMATGHSAAILLAMTEAAQNENDAALLELDFEEFMVVVQQLELQWKAIESNILVVGRSDCA